MSARATEDMPCPTCGQPVGVWDGFCEACGTELRAASGQRRAAGLRPAVPGVRG